MKLRHFYENYINPYSQRSSLFCNTTARQERHECDISATRATRVRLKCYTNDASATQVKSFDFDKNTRENIFLQPYISYMANGRLQGEEQFHAKKYLLEIPRSHAKMRLKNALPKLNFVMTKVISKSFTLDCSCNCPCTFSIVTHSNAASFSIKKHFM